MKINNVKHINKFADLDLEPSIKGVLLDIDNTCYEYAPCHNAAIDAAADAFKSKFDVSEDFYELYKIAQDEVKMLIPTHAASHSRTLYFKNIISKVNNHNLAADGLWLEDIYWSAFMNKMETVVGLTEFLAKCNDGGIKVVAVTDLTTRIQLQKLVKLGIDTYINEIVTSEESGADKPNPVIFQLALRKLGLPPSEVVMIGDSYEKDIKGANGVGISSIWLTNEDTIQTSARQARRE